MNQQEYKNLTLFPLHKGPLFHISGESKNFLWRFFELVKDKIKFNYFHNYYHINLSPFMSLVIEDADTNFKHIHRILNTNIDGKRTVPFAL